MEKEVSKTENMNKVYRPIDALPMMGVLCTQSTADRYIRNMYEAGLFRSSYKMNGRRWCITEEDIVYIRSKILSGEYCPSVNKSSKAA